ncbi:unnamed protein product [Caenorhabditis brenneri]
MAKGETVVYSALSSKETYSPIDGVPTQLDVTNVALQARPMGLEEINDVKDKLENTIDIYKSLLDVANAGLEFFEEESRKGAQNNIQVIAGLGDILKGVMMFIPKPEDPMVAQMNELADTVDRINEKIGQHYDEIKTLIIEINFYSNIFSPAFVLARYMRDCIKNPGPDSRECFKRAYLKHPPMRLHYLLTSCMEQKSTDPFQQAMDTLPRYSTFKKWKDIISRLLIQFMYLEAFASGHLGVGSISNCKLLLKKSQDVISMIYSWKQHYVNFQDFSYDLKGWLTPWLNANSKLSNAQKADAIKERLDDYMTTCSFYVVVFDHYHNEDEYWEDIKTQEYYYIRCYGPGGGNVFIHWDDVRFVSEQQWEDFKKKVQSYKQDTNRGRIIQELKSNPIPHAGFTFVLGGLNEEIRHSSSFTPREEGPGWWTYPYGFGGTRDRRLIAGYLTR